MQPRAAEWKTRMPQPVPDGQKQKVLFSISELMSTGAGGGSRSVARSVKPGSAWKRR